MDIELSSIFMLYLSCNVLLVPIFTQNDLLSYWFLFLLIVEATMIIPSSSWSRHFLKVVWVSQESVKKKYLNSSSKYHRLSTEKWKRAKRKGKYICLVNETPVERFYSSRLDEHIVLRSNYKWKKHDVFDQLERLKLPAI